MVHLKEKKMLIALDLEDDESSPWRKLVAQIRATGERVASLVEAIHEKT
jgi:hypothetical protein